MEQEAAQHLDQLRMVPLEEMELVEEWDLEGARAVVSPGVKDEDGAQRIMHQGLEEHKVEAAEAKMYRGGAARLRKAATNLSGNAQCA